MTSIAKLGKSRIKVSDLLTTPVTEENGLRQVQFVTSRGIVSQSGYIQLEDELTLTLVYDLLMSLPDFERAIKLVHGAFFAEAGASADHKALLDHIFSYASANANDLAEAFVNVPVRA